MGLPRGSEVTASSNVLLRSLIFIVTQSQGSVLVFTVWLVSLGSMSLERTFNDVIKIRVQASIDIDVIYKVMYKLGSSNSINRIKTKRLLVKFSTKKYLENL